MSECGAWLRALQLACAERIEHHLFYGEHGIVRMLHFVNSFERRFVIVVVHVAFHEVVGHERHILRIRETLEEFLKQSGGIAERCFPTLHACYGEVV